MIIPRSPLCVALLASLAWLAVLLAPPASAVVTIEWVTVGDPGNACQTQTAGCFGAVSDEYRIGKFEVSNAEYAEFLNAVAAADTHFLYSTNMGSDPVGGITRSGSPGSFTYSTIAGRENMPVNYVSFYDSLRFANWLHNGQPTGAQGDATTEDGAYTITPAGITANSIVRNAGATSFVTSEDEWYKAAYYDTGSMSYLSYPAGSNGKPGCAMPGPSANRANCVLGVGDLTAVGGYTGSASPNGTFDQGGNVYEWNEDIIGVSRGLRGGSFQEVASTLAASFRNSLVPTNEFKNVGFRVASVPGDPPLPDVPALHPNALLLLVFVLGSSAFAFLRRPRTAAPSQNRPERGRYACGPPSRR